MTKVNVKSIETINSDLNELIATNTWSQIYDSTLVGGYIGDLIGLKLKFDKNYYIHDGKHHADDVMCMALISLVCPDVTCNRIDRNSTPENPEWIVLDMGGGWLDHHTKKEYRDEFNREGILSSFGKLWLTLGRTRHLTPRQWRIIDDKLVKSIDLTDNTGEYFLISDVISKLPLDEAIQYAKLTLESLINDAIKASKDEEKLEDIIDESEIQFGILQLEEYPNVDKSFLNDLGVEWIIFPASDGSGFTLRSCGNELISENLRGIRNDGDIVFIHLGGFMGIFTSREAATEYAMDYTA